MDIFLVNVHSFSDVITNSSTDIFACKSKKSVEAIRILLNEIASAAGESAGLTVEEQAVRQFWDRTKDWCIIDMGYDYVYDKEYNVVGWMKHNRFDNYIPNNERKADPEITEDKLLKEWIDCHKSYFTSMEWKAKDLTYGSDITPETKIIVICGTEDNSIPYWLQEYIQSQMHAVRYHLG
jgi:hypothetical protein